MKRKSNDSKNNNWIDFDTIKLKELVNENKNAGYIAAKTKNRLTPKCLS